jgi:hypothetical protein
MILRKSIPEMNNISYTALISNGGRNEPRDLYLEDDDEDLTIIYNFHEICVTHLLGKSRARTLKGTDESTIYLQNPYSVLQSFTTSV